MKKVIALLAAVVVLAAGGWYGWQYYLDNVKLPETGPSEVVANYFAALQKRDFASAYDMVSHVYYVDTINQFKDRTSMYAPDMTLSVIGEHMGEGTAVVDVRIEVPLRFGTYKSESTMDLIREKRHWKIVHP